MPFGTRCEYPNFKACMDKMGGKVDDPEAYCATLMRKTEEQCRGKAISGRAVLTLDNMRALCPSCADKMVSLGIQELRLPYSELMEVIAKAPRNLAELCDKMGSDPGVFTACMDMVGGWDLQNPEGFCEWLHEQCTGEAPGEHQGKDISDMLQTNLALLERQAREQELEALEAYRKGVAEAPVMYKPLGGAFKATSEGIMTFVASEETEDRLGDVLRAGGWDLAAYQKNPVYLFGHDHSIPPIGTVPRVWVEGKQLLNIVRWDEEDPFAKFIKGKYERGVMKAQSVGFRPLDFKQRTDGGKGIEFLKQELLEISAVSVPAHPSAVLKALGNRRFGMVIPMTTEETHTGGKVQDNTPSDIHGQITAALKMLRIG